MNKTFYWSFVVVIVAAFMSSCSSKVVEDHKVAAPMQPLNCIAVVPAVTSVDKDETVRYEEAKALEKGAAFATAVLTAKLGSNERVRVLNSAQVSALLTGVTGGRVGTVSALGDKVNCDGILLTTVSKFRQRQGTGLAVDTPASASFQMVLKHAENGNVLWATNFEETQESLLSNIFSFRKAQKRGFKWITVEELMEQGIDEKLQNCPYLK
ncbi:hypothetical protein [Desulforhopalus singaporensis]|uniref:Lipoprotein n=1 Tax=Desulforhopalus singaporensis TaxID=91360 RepID=A0A1H0V6D0_9BACT|nr:hypothetical protein [Desulforhopalus singaporensis]SDP73738.1 hypothetical protein SAMN05660330_03889 [Desulforhopalus singaporensis]